MSVSEVNKIKKVKIGFIADDIRNLNEFGVFHNTTFGLMLAAQELNTKVLFTESNNLKIINNKVFAKFDEIRVKQKINEHFKVIDNAEYSLDSLNIIFARKDPPINESYLSYIQMLSLVPPKTLIVNNPNGILKSNEKLYVFNFPQIIPPTLVTSYKTQAFDFLKRYKEAVIKPLFNKGGEGVFYLNIESENAEANSIIEKSIDKEHTVIIQKYLPEVISGDKRIILLNGEPLGGIIRIPKKGEFRAHISRGADFKELILSKKDLAICEMLKPYLLRDGLYFVAIDLIGDYLIEVNFTCPSNLLEVGQCNSNSKSKNLAKDIVLWAIGAIEKIK